MLYEKIGIMIYLIKYMKYDVVYSLIAHEESVILNIITNIKKYNKKNVFLICFHLSDEMFKCRKKFENEYTIINESHYNKGLDKTMNAVLCRPHFENFKFLNDNGYSFNNYMTLSPAMMFIKQIDHFPRIDSETFKLVEKEQKISELDKNWSHWKTFTKNKKIVEIFQRYKIELINQQVSGRLMSVQMFQKIYDFMNEHDIFGKIERKSCFEEILVPSLTSYFGGKEVLYCKTFWDLKKSVLSVKEVDDILKNGGMPIVKRILSDPNNNVRCYINGLDS
jgi:hypothetical protein